MCTGSRTLPTVVAGYVASGIRFAEEGGDSTLEPTRQPGIVIAASVFHAVAVAVVALVTRDASLAACVAGVWAATATVLAVRPVDGAQSAQPAPGVSGQPDQSVRV